MCFVGQDASLGRGAATPFLASDAFTFSPESLPCDPLSGFQLLEKPLQSEFPIPSLIPRLLTFHHDAGRPVQEHHAGGDLVDVLAAVAARPDKRLLKVALPDSQPPKSLGPGIRAGTPGLRSCHGEESVRSPPARRAYRQDAGRSRPTYRVAGDP